MEYYYELKYGDYKDLKTVYIPPASVASVYNRWENGQPIKLSTGGIPANQIRSFEKSDRPFNSQPLLEAVAQAFKEPMVTDGEVNIKWVKKVVTKDKWERYYSASPGYRRLDESDGLTTVAFRVPTHLVNSNTMQYCDEQEISRLTRVD